MRRRIIGRRRFIMGGRLILLVMNRRLIFLMMTRGLILFVMCWWFILFVCNWRFIWGWGLIRHWGTVISRRMVLAVCGRVVSECFNRLEGPNGGGEIIGSDGISQRIHRIPSVKGSLWDRDGGAVPDGLTHCEWVQGYWIEGGAW